jgi:hypothetical protein
LDAIRTGTNPPTAQNSGERGSAEKQNLWAIAAIEIYGPGSEMVGRPDENVKNTIQIIKEQAAKNVTEKWPSRLKAIENTLVKIDGLVQAGLAFDPTPYGSLGWSVVSFGLDVVVEGGRIRDFILEANEYTAAIIDRYAVYDARYIPKLPEGEVRTVGMTSMEKAIIRVYGAILKFSDLMKKSYEQDRWSTYEVFFLPCSP